MEVYQILVKHGVQLANTSTGSRKTQCPQCSHNRKPKNRRQRCLSVTIQPDRVLFNCFNCPWTACEFRGGLITKPKFQNNATRFKQW